MVKASVEDRLAIRELLDRSCAAVIRKDATLWSSTWAKEGRWKLPSMDAPASGLETLTATFVEKMAYVDFMHMSASPTELVFSDNRAHGQVYCREAIHAKTGEQRYIVGCYHDEYIRRGGSWLFLSRDYEIIGMK